MSDLQAEAPLILADLFVSFVGVKSVREKFIHFALAHQTVLFLDWIVVPR